MNRILLISAVLVTAFFAANAQVKERGSESRQYTITQLGTLSGTSRGNSINDRNWVSGYSGTSTGRRHASFWKNNTLIDLGTLGGPDGYSNVVWPVKNDHGLIAGISQTNLPDPNHENWSCSPFLFGVGENLTGNTCVGFVWENGMMRPLPTLGGPNGFAAGANNLGQITGWAENMVHDTRCVAPQVLQFHPVVWGPRNDSIHELPLIANDSSGAATGINDRGQAIGISGICDQAVGRYTAAHAVIWENGRVSDIGGSQFDAPYWNTPMAINERGDVAGFAGTPGDIDANLLRAFIWTRRDGVRFLPPLPGHVYSEARGLNDRRQAVGISCSADFSDCRAVLWEKGFVSDLKALIPGYTGVLTSAQDINDEGEITGRAFDPVANKRLAFLAKPVDEDAD